MHFCHENEKTVTGPICSRIVALYHQNSHLRKNGYFYLLITIFNLSQMECTRIYRKPFSLCQENGTDWNHLGITWGSTLM